MDVYGALADATRRSIVEMLTSGEMEAGSIAARFEVSRPAISRHLRVLRESALVRSRADGTKRMYRLDGNALTEVSDWAERQRLYWTDRLDALERHLDQQPETEHQETEHQETEHQETEHQETEQEETS